MDYMHDLKDLLCAELEEYAEKGKKSGKMSAADLDGIHKLTDTVKNILKINMLEEEPDGGYSQDSRWMGEGRMYGNSYEDGNMSYEGGSSYARRGGGRGRGRNAKRDSMGRYSRDNGMMHSGGSYARGGRGGNQGGGNRGGGYSGEDGYSRDGAKEYMMEQLEDMMEQAEKPAEREALKRCMQALERA